MQSTKNSDQQGEIPTTIRLGFVPGVIPAKWVRIWRERHPNWNLELVALESMDRGAAVHRSEVDVALVRPPLVSRSLHAVVLYEEQPVVVFPKDHHFAAADSLNFEDLAPEVHLNPLDNAYLWPGPDGSVALPGIAAKERPADTAAAIALVAAGIGVLVVPQSLARLHHRKDLTFAPLTAGPVAPVALVWRQDDERELIEEFHGIVRGRTENSTRGANNQPLVGKEAKALKAQRIAEKNARRAAEFAEKHGRKQKNQAGRAGGPKRPAGGGKVSGKGRPKSGPTKGSQRKSGR